MVNSRFIKLSNDTLGINLNLVTEWCVRPDGNLIVSFGEAQAFYEEEDAQKMLQLLISLSIDLDEMLAKQNETPRNC
ncbi:hypothetical protein [Planktothrix sp.]|uniref:hypothetical protein n=1 Tax=Planktothrix sp. TaxID=3088171 RepID=UPI0038D4D98C